MYVQVSVIVITVLYGLIYAMMNPIEFGFKSLIDPFYFLLRRWRQLDMVTSAPNQLERKWLS